MPQFDRTATVASGAGNTVISPHPSRVRNVLVTTAGTGTGSVLFFDSATTNSGTVIGVVPATVAVGALFSFNMPTGVGIVCQNVASGPALTISFE
jgi:hypothetical protein